MGNRRAFLRLAAAGAMLPSVAWSQKATKKPEGFLVNDVHGQLSATLVYRIAQPDTLDGVRAALKLAVREKRALCIAGGRHSMGSQAFAADGVLVDTRKLTQVLSFDGERGLIEVESGIEWPELVEAIKLLDAHGRLNECSRTENPELFSLAIGGYGLFGVIYSVSLRLVPRRQLERVVEVRVIEGLQAAFADRVRDGFLYGDYQYAI